MDDFTAGPASGAREDATGPWGGGSPPPVLLGALGAALLIAVVLVAFLVGSGSGSGGDSRPLPAGSAGVDDPGAEGAAAPLEKRVLLTVAVEGGGSGRVHIGPLDVDCTDTCEHEFTTGTRVTVSADASGGSRFEGWDDACAGDGTCSFLMDRERSVTATFEGSPAVSQCEDKRDNDGDGLTDADDPGCDNDNTEAPDNSPRPAFDCADGRDNDGDGLVDSAQDPDCADGTEAGGQPAPVTPPPATTTPSTPPPPATTPPAPVPAGTLPVSECHDGRDNDGDGRTDRPADPGCDADATEAGG
jgi:hypothetical protein